MSTTAATTPPAGLITADDFAQQYAGQRAELFRGRVVESGMPFPLHGKVCGRVVKYLSIFVDDHDLGHVMGNDTLIRVAQNPDTVRGPDVCYYSFERLPKGNVPNGLLSAVPELAVEVRSPSNTWSKLLIKSGEYLSAGVLVVVLLDPDTATATVFRENELHQTLDNCDDLTLPDVLPGFSVPVRQLFT